MDKQTQNLKKKPRKIGNTIRRKNKTANFGTHWS